MFSSLLKELRKKHNNISQAALAEKLQVSQQAVGRWEKDLNMPDYDILKRLALFSQVTTDYLLEMPDIKDFTAEYYGGWEHSNMLPRATYKKHTRNYNMLVRAIRAQWTQMAVPSRL